jgi:hypothetical protein
MKAQGTAPSIGIHTHRPYRQLVARSTDVTAALRLSPEPTPYLALGLSECLDNFSVGFGSLSDPKHSANLLPRGT